MTVSSGRRGIERRILNSILLVGIFPLALVIIVGYITARGGQSNAVKESLLIAAQKTSIGLRIAGDPYLRVLGKLAAEPKIVAALAPDGQARPAVLGDAELLDAVQRHFDVYADVASGRFAPAFSLYDANGQLLLTTDESLLAVSDEDSRPMRWPDYVKEPTFVDIELLKDLGAYAAVCAAPVYAPDGSDELLGFVGSVYEIDPLLRFALGLGTELNEPARETYSYQVVFYSEGYLWTAYAAQGETSSIILRTQRADPTFAAALTRTGASSGTMRIHDYQDMPGPPRDVFLAYCRLFENMNLYLVVYRSSSEALRSIHLGGAFALIFCVVMIALLCLNAYRNVHNNIVRPVSLLNEGAQIIGQGDLDLKLKIGTGDEIEELASSFNKMALALKRNIGRLEESEEKYRSVVTSMRDGIFQTAPDWSIGFLNPAGVEMFRFESVEAALGQDVRDIFYSPEDFARVSSELAERGFVERTRVWMKRCDGKAIIVELSANTIHGDDRQVIGIEGILRDLSKSVRLEREARDRAERLSAINQIANVINSSLEAGRLYESLVVEIKRLIDFDYASIALLDERGDTFDMRMLWPEQERGEGRSLPLDDTRSCVAWVVRNRERLAVIDLLDPDSRFSGEDFPKGMRSCLCVPLYATGRIIGTLNLGSDRADAFSKHDIEVIEQVAPHVAVAIRNAQLLENLQVSLEEVTRAREKLHAVNEELKTLDEMKTNLLSNVSHELRTPLVSVMGYTDMIFNGKAGPITDLQKEYLAISLRNIERLVTLIENLLDFSRLHRGAETVVFDKCDIVDCARASLQLVKPVADGREIVLELHAPEDSIVVEGDKGKLGQVFNNLLSNAVKFNRNGGKVTVGIHRGEETVDVTVTDTGIGIPPEALDKVFTRFYQYDGSSTRKYGGTGIGLSIAQDIIRLHGSRITVTSEVGAGSTFRFSLPLHARVETAAAVEEETEESRPAETQMLVELLTHDSTMSAQIGGLLLSEGVNLIQARNAAHAVALAQRHSPDCILVDVDSAPQGARLLEELLADHALGATPIILLTDSEEVYERYRTSVATRVKRGFRKSALLSGIYYAITPATPPERALGDKILCVDDDPDILIFMARCLEAEGYRVDTCPSGEEALDRLASREYGLVLLDIAMPGIDGWETCRRIKSDPALSTAKVYMVTAKPIDSNSPKTRVSRSDGYILKPFRPEDLAELVNGVMQRRTAKKE